MAEHTGFGNILRSARKAQGISQEKLSIRSGIDKSNLVEIEGGKINPTYRTMKLLAAGLGANLKIDFEFDPEQNK